MAYTPFQDGTQAFGIPDSPVSINATTYILEDFNITEGSSRVEIRAPNGVPTGQVLIPEVITATATLQKASGTTPIPARGSQFTFLGASWIIQEVGDTYTQGQYQKVPVTLVMKINP